MTRSLAEVSGLKVCYELSGPALAPVVVLSHSLGADLTMWDPQERLLARSFRVLRYDTRGHGGTTLAAEPWTLAMLANDVLGLLDVLGVARAHFCGLSMGGLIGMAALNAARIDKLVLSNTARASARPRAERADQERERGGMRSVSAAILERWFTPAGGARGGRGVRRLVERTQRGATRQPARSRDAD